VRVTVGFAWSDRHGRGLVRALRRIVTFINVHNVTLAHCVSEYTQLATQRSWTVTRLVAYMSNLKQNDAVIESHVRILNGRPTLRIM